MIEIPGSSPKADDDIIITGDVFESRYVSILRPRNRREYDFVRAFDHVFVNDLVGLIIDGVVVGRDN